MEYSGPVRFGVIGVGDVFTRYFYRGFRSAELSGDVKLSKVADVMPREIAIERLASSQSTADVARMITEGEVQYAEITHDSELPQGFIDDDIDAVYVATPNSTHRSYVDQSLRARKHVLCEKPLAPDLTDVYDMIQMAGLSNVVCQVATHYLYKSPNLMMYDPSFAMDNGFDDSFLNLALRECGKITSIEGSIIQSTQEDTTRMPDGSLAYRNRLKNTVLNAAMGGGVGHDLFEPHILGIALKAGLPELRATSVKAYNFDPRTFSAETAFVADMRAHGANFSENASAHFTAAKFSDKKNKSFHIVFGDNGKRGEIHIDFDDKSIEYSSSRTTLRHSGMGFDDYANVVSKFVDCIRREGRLVTPFSESYIKARIMNKIRGMCSGWENPLEFYNSVGDGSWDGERSD